MTSASPSLLIENEWKQPHVSPVRARCAQRPIEEFGDITGSDDDDGGHSEDAAKDQQRIGLRRTDGPIE